MHVGKSSMTDLDRNKMDEEDERELSGRFPVRLPKYLHRQLRDAARAQGVSLNQFVLTAAVMAAGINAEIAVTPATAEVGSNRVSEEEYNRIWNGRFG